MQNTADTAQGSHRRLGRNLQYQTVPHGQTRAHRISKGLLLLLLPQQNYISPGLQGITKHFWFSETFKDSSLYLSLIDQNNKRRSLADACGRKTSCRRKKRCLVKHWRSNCTHNTHMKFQPSLFWRTAASLKACTAQQESLLFIGHHRANSWHRAGRLPLPDRAETDSCPHTFQPFRDALKNKPSLTAISLY